MKKTKKALASLAIAGMVLTMLPFSASATGTVPTRLAGTTAPQTAVKIADQTGWTGTAILASSASYGMVDALTSGPLATFLKAPILLQEPGAVLNADTNAELIKLAVKTVYVTSGTAVISQAVLDELKNMGIIVAPLGGFDRAATSVNIAQKMSGVTNVAVANSEQDALSIAAIASASGSPILLTDKDSVPDSVVAFLASSPNITTSDAIGGPGVISDAVMAAFPNATRHWGNTAYDTNSQVIQNFASSLAFENIYIANGVTGIDALAGAPLAAQTKSPIVLTDGRTVPVVASFVQCKASHNTVFTALGGEAVVPENVRIGVTNGPAKKPVIYLYPTTEQQISVKLMYDGRFTCTYPEYKNGWEVIAHPDGSLFNLGDNKEYSYLFWEGILANNRWDMTKGFVVAGKDTKDFLQDKLSLMGLTPKEYNDFIVYWLPIMQDNEYNLITFANEEYAQRVHLSIDPNPDSVLRVFMVYKPITSKIYIAPQQLTTFNRTGYSVVEWGGTEVR